MNKILLIFLSLFLLISCSGIANNPEVGVKFNSDIWADRMENGIKTNDPNNFYLYVGPVDGGYLYKKNPKYYTATSGDFKGGIIVSSSRIVKVLTPVETNKYIAEINEKNRNTQIEEQKQKQLALQKQQQNQSNEDDKKYGTSGMGIFINFINNECLVGRGYNCDLRSPMLMINANVRNNLRSSVKDVSIKCRHFAKSGTELTSVLSMVNNKAVIYQKWNPGEVRSVQFNVGDVEQRSRTTCDITSWN